MTLNGICYIFGAGERSSCLDTPAEDSFIIAADGGFDYLRDLGLQADVVLGDFDSIRSSQYLPPDSIHYPKEKDDTDMMLAASSDLKTVTQSLPFSAVLAGVWIILWQIYRCLLIWPAMGRPASYTVIPMLSLSSTTALFPFLSATRPISRKIPVLFLLLTISALA